MKKCFIVLFCFIALAGCKKNPFDFRSKYLGNYNFSIHRTAWTLSGPTLDTTYFYTGEVEKGSETNTAIISFSESVSIETDIYEDGTISVNHPPHQSLQGEFESAKEVKFKLANSGLGGGSAYDVTGVKK